MKKPRDISTAHQRWSSEAFAMVAQASGLSGNKLEQLVVRLQRHSGRPKRECWRFVIHHGVRKSEEHRRWTEEEIEYVRESLVKLTVAEIAKKLKRTPRAVRSMLVRNQLGVRDIRCDVFSVESLALVLKVRTEEVRMWITEGWLQATLTLRGKRQYYSITPESLATLIKNHLPDLLRRGAQNQILFQAYFQYCYSPKHTVGEQLLDVRRDKRERAAFAAWNGEVEDETGEEDEEGYEGDEREFHIELDDDEILASPND